MRRKGFVLPAALACIVVMAALAAGALFSTSQEARSVSLSLLDEKAVSFAEAVARQAIGGWACRACDSLPVGGVIVQSSESRPPLESTLYITRLDSTLYLVLAEGRVVTPGVTRLKRRLSIAVRISRDSLGRTLARPLDLHSWTAVYDM